MMYTVERKHINVFKRAVEDQIGAKLIELQTYEEPVRKIKTKTLKEKFRNDNALDDTAYYIFESFVSAIDKYFKEREFTNNIVTTKNSKNNILVGSLIPTFKKIKIGDQIWADRNLNVNHFRNGEPIPQAISNEEWIEAGDNKQPAWCHYDNDPENGKKYGKLYNWYAVNDPRGLAPEGWEVPTDDEWKILEGTIDSKYKMGDTLWGKKSGEDMMPEIN